MIVKNSYGIANIGSNGYSSQNTIGGYTPRGFIRINLNNGNYTLITYYNDPEMAIPYNGKWYLHDELPAYMFKWKGNWFVGTHDQISILVNSNKKNYKK